MRIKFNELSNIESQPVPLAGKPERNNDHAVIKYVNMRNQTLNVSVTAEEIEKIDFSQDFRYMKLPDFLMWVKGSKGPYLTHKETGAATDNTQIQW